MEAAFRALWLLPLPTVAAVNGHAIAGGGVLTLACDRRLMAEGSWKIGVPELKVGVPFPALPFEIVRSALAPPAAAEATLAAATYTPGDARAHGWLDEVVAPAALLDRACAVADELAAIPTATYALTKRQLRAPALARLAAAAALDAEVSAAWRTPAVFASVRAYVEKTLKR